MTNDPYAALGVAPGATPDEIRTAYRKLAKQYHPDLHPGDEQAARRMNEINEAYEQLKNPQTAARDARAYGPGSARYTGQSGAWGYGTPFGYGGTYRGNADGANQTQQQEPYVRWYVWEEPPQRPVRRRHSIFFYVFVIMLLFRLLSGLFWLGADSLYDYGSGDGVEDHSYTDHAQTQQDADFSHSSPYAPGDTGVRQ